MPGIHGELKERKMNKQRLALTIMHREYRVVIGKNKKMSKKFVKFSVSFFFDGHRHTENTTVGCDLRLKCYLNATVLSSWALVVLSSRVRAC